MRRNLAHPIAAYWFLWFPALLIAFESLCFEHSSFIRYHYMLALRDQPTTFVFSFVLIMIRVYVGYLALACLWELGGRAVVRNAWVRTGLASIASALAMHYIFHQRPGASSLYALPQFPRYLFMSSLVFFWVGWRFGETRACASGRVIACFVVGAICLWATRFDPWTGKLHASPSKAQAPSYVLLGIDGVPHEVLTEQDEGKFVAPNFMQRWRDRGHEFTEAYSESNSTYTSWHALLSGTHPINSGVDTLYPETKPTAAQWLPRQLQARGYQTVFMTDCAATSFFQKDAGWSATYQPDTGIFGCGRSLMTSIHPLVAAWQWTGLYPEIESFCSSLYQPKTFFDHVRRVQEKLSQSGPHLLAVHSCLPHNVMVQHVPPFSSPLRRDLPRQRYRSHQKLNLMLSIRWLDALLPPLFSTAEELKQNLVLFSDHGTRIERDGKHLKYFTHALGRPVNRFQYHVPLFFFGPQVEPQKSEHQVVLSQVYDRILHNSPLLPKRPAVLISAVPIPFGSKQVMLKAYKESKIRADGTQVFSDPWLKRFRVQRPFAVLDLPFRLVVQRDRLELYDEYRDPMNRVDISSKHPAEVTRLLEAACLNYPKICPISHGKLAKAP